MKKTLYIEGIGKGTTSGLIKVEFSPKGDSTWMPDEVKVTVLKVEIISLQFTSDHQDSKGNNLLKKSWKDKQTVSFQTFTYVGNPFEQPEWLPDYSDNMKTRNNPITQTMGTPLQIKMKIKVSPDGIEFKLVSNETDSAFIFESVEDKSTGKEMPLNSAGRTDGVMKASGNLPKKVQRIKKPINWKLLFKNPQSDKFLEFPIGTSGGNKDFPDGHWIFTTIDTPNETCSRNKKMEFTYPWNPKDNRTVKPLPNALTFYRTSFICETCQKANESENLYSEDCAKLLREMIINKCDVNGNSALEENIWGMLDRGNEFHQTGQCVPQSFLLEMCMRLLGLKDSQAAYRYITAVDNLPVPEVDGNSPGDWKKRECPNGHGKEWLFFVFPPSAHELKGRNDGEGTCRILGKYYAGVSLTVSNNPLELIQTFEKTGMVQTWYYPNDGKLIKDEEQKSPNP